MQPTQRLTMGELEMMADYAGVRSVTGDLHRALRAARQAVRAVTEDAEGGGDAETRDDAMQEALLDHLPARVFTALLGVQRLRADPAFGPERWGSIDLFDPGLAAEDLDGLDPAAELDPTPAASAAPKRKKRSGGSASTPARNA